MRRLRLCGKKKEREGGREGALAWERGRAAGPQVDSVNGPDVVCVANNDTTLDGLLTIFHTERSVEGVSNMQNRLPILTPADEEAIAALASEFEIDFLSLSFTRSTEDITVVREFLEKHEIRNTKVCGAARRGRPSS